MDRPYKPLAKPSKPYYTVKEAAGTLGYSEGTVRNMLSDGTLRGGQRKRGAQIRIRGESVEAVKARLNGDAS